MKVDANLGSTSLTDAQTMAKLAEELEFDGLWANETSHDQFLRIAIASQHTNQLQLGTAVALAFPRSPMLLAHTAWDLQNLSQGRFILGLGSQVKGHMERRSSVKWDDPVARMLEVILSLKAIWRCWQTGERLNFNGRFYSFNLMTPFFNPGQISHPEIPIFLAAVNRKMCVLAGELCQGLHVHPFHTVRYLKEVILPEVEEGVRRAGRKRNDIAIAVPVFAALGDSDEEIQQAKEKVRQQVAFYGSTRTYGGVLELHGWGEICERLHSKSVHGDWGGMASDITDKILEWFAVVGRWDQVAELLKQRYDGIVDRIRLYAPLDPSQSWRRFVGDFRT